MGGVQEIVFVLAGDTRGEGRHGIRIPNNEAPSAKRLEGENAAGAVEVDQIHLDTDL